jgi:Na+/alanine symporter
MDKTWGKTFEKGVQMEGCIIPGRAQMATIGIVVGTASMAGVVTAIALRDIGATFWMRSLAF